MNWYDKLERFVVERRTLSAVITLGAIVAAVWIPRAVSASAAHFEASARKDEAAQRAVEAHKAWLRSRPIEEKRAWDFSVCRPGNAGRCECEHWDSNVVSFAEILPNGDVACHQTK